MDQPRRISYIRGMSTAKPSNSVTLKQLGGIKALLRMPGLVLHTLRAGRHVGVDECGNQYYEERRPVSPKHNRRWVVYPGVADASTIGPEWHSWLHYTTAAPLPETNRLPWQKPHQANLTGTQDGYRPAGHDYEGGNRARAAADYEAWTPDL
jgi:NADH:ubiquinone oxidoreductase subunit